MSEKSSQEGPVTFNHEEGTVTITNDRYGQLIADEAVLNALRNGGVDNWDWYHNSLDDAGIKGDGSPVDEEEEQEA
jgi:hypothetical protein